MFLLSWLSLLANLESLPGPLREPVDHLPPEGRVVRPMDEITGPVRRKVRSENRRPARLIIPASNERVALVAGDQRRAGLERYPIVTAQRPARVAPRQPCHNSVIWLVQLESKALCHFDAVV